MEALQAGARLLERRTPLVFALRERELSEDTPYLSLLAGYERFVDLRRDDGANDDEWAPVFEPLEELISRRKGTKSLTDVLAF